MQARRAAAVTLLEGSRAFSTAVAALATGPTVTLSWGVGQQVSEAPSSIADACGSQGSPPLPCRRCRRCLLAKRTHPHPRRARLAFGPPATSTSRRRFPTCPTTLRRWVQATTAALRARARCEVVRVRAVELKLFSQLPSGTQALFR